MLGQAIGDLLPLALAVAICPIPIVAVILMLFSERARANSAMFVLGWIIGVLGGTIVVLIIANTQDLTQSNGQPEDSVSTVKLLLGVGLILLAAREWRGRPKEGETPTLPKYLQAIDTLTPPKALGLGVILSVANPKSLLLIIAGAITISQADLSDSDTIIAVLVFVLISVSTVVVPVVLYNVMGSRAQPILDSMRAWLTAEQRDRDGRAAARHRRRGDREGHRPDHRLSVAVSRRRRREIPSCRWSSPARCRYAPKRGSACNRRGDTDTSHRASHGSRRDPDRGDPRAGSTRSRRRRTSRRTTPTRCR